MIRKIDKGFDTLSSLAEMFSGIKTYGVGRGKPSQTEKIRNTKPFTSIKTDDTWSPCFDGKHTVRY
ncbi:MAG: hypothetical protein ABIR81_12545 [Ginsengibacter sp.]